MVESLPALCQGRTGGPFCLSFSPLFPLYGCLFPLPLHAKSPLLLPPTRRFRFYSQTSSDFLPAERRSKNCVSCCWGGGLFVCSFHLVPMLSRQGRRAAVAWEFGLFLVNRIARDLCADCVRMLHSGPILTLGLCKLPCKSLHSRPGCANYLSQQLK